MKYNNRRFTSSFIVPTSSFLPHAAIDNPPCTNVVTGTLTGPVSPRRFTHAAQIHTCAPLAIVSGKVISNLSFVACPWNCQPVGSVGYSWPTNVYTKAHTAPAGLLRFVREVGSKTR